MRTRSLLSWVLPLLFAVIGVLLLRFFVLTSCILPTGEFLLVNRWSYGLRTPLPSMLGYHRWLPQSVEKGDLVAFESPLENSPLEYRKLFICYCIPTGSFINLNSKPFQIPQKGVKVKVTPENLQILHEMINLHEGRYSLISSEGRLYVDGTPITDYTPTHNYYWMITPKIKNISQSEDSFRFGLVPEELLIGRVFHQFSF